MARSCLLVLAWIALTAALSGVGEVITHSQVITSLDRHVTTWVVGHRTPALDHAMTTITWLGSWVAVAVTGVTVALLAFRRCHAPATLILFALAWAGEYGTVNLVKHVVGRPRPPRAIWLVSAHGASFPSGHAANAALVGATGAIVAFTFSRRRSIRVAAVVLCCLLVGAVGFSRIELGVHWMTDVAAGVLVTVLWSAVVTGLFATHLPIRGGRDGAA